jgi:hypothetical protein
MRKLFLIAALAASTAAAANAATWTATCNDGKNVQYVQTIDGVGFLYLKTSKDFFQTARLAQTSFDGTTICGTVTANAPADAEPVTEVCANKSSQVITLKYKDPDVKTSTMHDEGTFCAATVTIRATNLKVK